MPNPGPTRLAAFLALTPCSIAPSVSARLTSPADCQRSSGSFWRHVLTTLATAEGCVSRPGQSCEGRLPVSISYNTHPNAYRSDRASACLPSHCSGAIYAGVPITAPACVSVGSPGSAAMCAKPKSRTFTPCFVRRIFAGFRSRCVIPLRCAASSASQICPAYRRASDSGSGPFSGVPSTSSITR